MSIIVNGNIFRTLAEPLYVNGKHVIEAYANGEKVYPADDLSGYFFKVRGKIQRHVSRYLPYQDEDFDGEVVRRFPLFINYDYTVSFAALLEFPISYWDTDGAKYISASPAKAELRPSMYGIFQDPVSRCIPSSFLQDDGINFKCRLENYHSYTDRKYIYPNTWHLKWHLPYYFNTTHRPNYQSGNHSRDYNRKVSCIFNMQISNIIPTQQIEYWNFFYANDFEGRISPMRHLNYSLFNGTFGPFYDRSHTLDQQTLSPEMQRNLNNILSHNRIYIDSDNAFVWTFMNQRPSSEGSGSDKLYEHRLESMFYGIVKSPCTAYGEHFRGSGGSRIGPRRNVDQTFVTMLVGPDNDAYASYSDYQPICPITDILYCGSYNTAPDWAKTLSVNDLL